MVAVTNALPLADTLLHPAVVAPLADTPAARASIASYLGAGERMLSMADLTWKLCAGLFVLVLLAWAMGLLPGSVKLF